MVYGRDRGSCLFLLFSFEFLEVIFLRVFGLFIGFGLFGLIPLFLFVLGFIMGAFLMRLPINLFLRLFHPR